MQGKGRASIHQHSTSKLITRHGPAECAQAYKFAGPSAQRWVEFFFDFLSIIVWLEVKTAINSRRDDFFVLLENMLRSSFCYQKDDFPSAHGAGESGWDATLRWTTLQNHLESIFYRFWADMSSICWWFLVNFGYLLVTFHKPLPGGTLTSVYRNWQNVVFFWTIWSKFWMILNLFWTKSRLAVTTPSNARRTIWYVPFGFPEIQESILGATIFNQKGYFSSACGAGESVWEAT